MSLIKKLLGKEGNYESQSRRSFLKDIAQDALILTGIGSVINCAPTQRNIQIEKIYPEIKISGDERFTKQARKALNLIADKDPEKYKEIIEYVREIKQGTPSGMDAQNKIYKVSDLTAFGYSNGRTWDLRDNNLNWFAGTIVHDAEHSKLYWKYKDKYNPPSVPSIVYFGKEAEVECIRIQVDFLKKVGASGETIKYFKSFSGEYCEFGDRKCLKDFEKRKW